MCSHLEIIIPRPIRYSSAELLHRLDARRLRPVFFISQLQLDVVFMVFTACQPKFDRIPGRDNHSFNTTNDVIIPSPMQWADFCTIMPLCGNGDRRLRAPDARAVTASTDVAATVVEMPTPCKLR